MRVPQTHENNVEYPQKAIAENIADNRSIHKIQTQILAMLDINTTKEERAAMKNSSCNVTLTFSSADSESCAL